jgi:hypothetical protein
MRLTEWVRDDTQPPASRIPSIARGELVEPDRIKWPVKGVELPRHFVQAFRMDFGPEWDSSAIITKEPPGVGAPYATLVPQVDADGNEIAGVHMPEVDVPLATYTGWNFRPPTMGAPSQMFSFAGSWFVWPKAKVLERYANREAYLAKVDAAARDLISQGFLLETDVKRVIDRSAAEWDYVMAK